MLFRSRRNVGVHRSTEKADTDPESADRRPRVSSGSSAHLWLGRIDTPTGGRRDILRRDPIQFGKSPNLIDQTLKI